MIVPTILTADLDEVKRKLNLLRGQVGRVQVDIIDGEFTDNKTINLADLFGLAEKNGFSLDIHLMVKDPASLLDRDWPGLVDRITGQIETMPSQVEFVRTAKESGFLAGLAVDLKTEVTKLNAQALDITDQVLLLGVKAGFSGQKIDPTVLAKIKELAVWKQKENWSFKIGIDGGIDETSLAFCYKIGAEEFFIGSAIWESGDPIGMIRKLEKIISGNE
ncbi:MAG: hypothetical protein PHX72_03215 [Candidatus Shapirobacteria bacterium]|nr:hypothetical protein [Candidatus Shapirobacteria bacterium]